MTTLAHTGKRSTILVAVALSVVVFSGFVYFAPTLAQEPAQVSALDSKTGGDIGSMSASRKVRCIMPPAWRRGCGE
jgi:hypothetical protein